MILVTVLLQGVHQQLSKKGGVTLSTADGLGLLFDHQALFQRKIIVYSVQLNLQADFIRVGHILRG